MTNLAKAQRVDSQHSHTICYILSDDHANLLIATSVLLLAAFVSSIPTQLNLMPMPASVQRQRAAAITQSFSVAVTGIHDASLDGEVQRFQTQLSRQTGIPFRPKAGAAPTLQIHADHGRQAVQKLGEDESYELTVADSGAKLTAPTTLGVHARAADISPTRANHAHRIRRPRRHHQRSAALSRGAAR